MGLTDFLFGDDSAQKDAAKAAQNAQFSPYLYAGPGGSLSGFGTIAPTPAGAAPTVNGTPSLGNTATKNGAIIGAGGLIDTGMKSDGNGYPVLMDPSTGMAYVSIKGKPPQPASGRVIGPDGKTKINLTAGAPIPSQYLSQTATQQVQSFQQQQQAPQQAQAPAYAPTPQGGIQTQVGGSQGPAGAFQNAAAPGAIDPATGQPVQGPAPAGTTIAPTNNPGQAAFGDLGNLNPIQQALVKAFPQLIQSGVQQSGGSNTQVNYAPSAYDQFGDVYQHNLQLLREQAKPQEEQQYNSLQNRLFGQGRLGTTGGNMNIEAFAKGLGESDVARQLSAFNVAQGVAQQQEQTRLANAGMDAQNIERRIAQGNMTFSQAQQLFGNLSSLNTMGSQNFTNALNASIARSNANAGAAGALASLPADNGAFGSIISAAAKAYGGGQS